MRNRGDQCQASWEPKIESLNFTTCIPCELICWRCNLQDCMDEYVANEVMPHKSQNCILSAHQSTRCTATTFGRLVSGLSGWKVRELVHCQESEQCDTIKLLGRMFSLSRSVRGNGIHALHRKLDFYSIYILVVQTLIQAKDSSAL